MGHRSVSSHGRLLYHSVRTVEREPVMRTVSQLRVVSRALDRWDKAFLDELVRHVQRDAEKQPACRKKLRQLFRKERWIGPEEALELGLVDNII